MLLLILRPLFHKMNLVRQTNFNTTKHDTRLVETLKFQSNETSLILPHRLQFHSPFPH